MVVSQKKRLAYFLRSQCRNTRRK